MATQNKIFTHLVENILGIDPNDLLKLRGRGFRGINKYRNMPIATLDKFEDDGTLNAGDCQELKFFRMYCEINNMSNSEILAMTDNDWGKVNVRVIDTQFRHLCDTASIVTSNETSSTSPIDTTLLISEYEDFTSYFNLTDSTIVSSEQSDKLIEWIGPDKDVGLVYRCSRDGWDARSFHKLCDERGGTLTIIKSMEGYIFGGYIDTSWKSRSKIIACKDAFIYTLHNHAGIPPTKMESKCTEKAAYSHPNWGPTFGLHGPLFGGHDIYISNNANINTKSYTSIGSSYECPPAIDLTCYNGATNQTFLTGSRNFQVSELEVFLVK